MLLCKKWSHRKSVAMESMDSVRLPGDDSRTVDLDAVGSSGVSFGFIPPGVQGPVLR